MKTIAIDFETRQSQTGQCLFRSALPGSWAGASRALRSDTIRPRENWFAFTWLHGITARTMCASAGISRRAGGVSATSSMARWCSRTNAGFDAGVMQGCARAYR